MLGATPCLTDTLRAPNLTEGDISSFRIFVCAGAPIPQPLAEEACRRLPRLVPVWGMTENSAVTAVRPSDPAEQIVNTDGQALPGMEVTVLDDNGAAAGARPGRRAVHPRGLPIRRLCAGSALYRAILHTRWLVRDRRSGGDGRYGVHPHYREKQGHHHPRWRKHPGQGD